MKFNIIPASFLNKNGPVECTAQVNDPEGDEIVSYTWVLTTPAITTASGTIQPKYEFEGKNVVFPLLYTYGNGQYDVTLTVTDSAGNNATNTIQFKMDKSSFETTTNYVIKTIILDLILNTIYEDWLTEDQKHYISDPLWNFVFGPINNTFSLILTGFILPILPKFLKDIILSLYSFVFSMLENKFPKPVS